MLYISNMLCDDQSTEHERLPMAAVIQLSFKLCSSAARTGKFNSDVTVLRNLRLSSCHLHKLHESQVQKGIHADYQLVG